MRISIHRESVVGPDGTISLTIPELQPDQAAPTAATPEAPIHIIDLIKDLPGHRLFKSAEEVDEYLRQERDSWDR
jgi:hypothetical protein